MGGRCSHCRYLMETEFSMESITDFKRLSALFALSALLVATAAGFAMTRDVFAANSTCFTRAAYTPYVTDGPSSGDAFLHGEVYLNCNTYENRTESAYLMEDLFLSSDAQIQKYTYADYDTWHSRTAHYGALG